MTNDRKVRKLEEVQYLTKSSVLMKTEERAGTCLRNNILKMSVSYKIFLD